MQRRSALLARLRSLASQCAPQALLLRLTPTEKFSPDIAHCITQANSKEMLPGILQNIDHLAL